MSPDYNIDYISYRIQKSKESIEAAIILTENHLLTSAVNRLYYACFYIVDALLYHNKVKAKSHSGAKNQFSLNFIKTGKIPVELGELYSELLDLRQEGDYGSKFELKPEEVTALIAEVQLFVSTLERLIA